MGIVGIRMINELKGIPQLNMDLPSRKKSIATTRTFDYMIDKKEDLKERIATFAVKCSEKLRAQKSCCNYVTVFLHTNFFRDDLIQHHPSITLALSNPHNSAIEVSKYAQKALKAIYKKGYQYKKAGVIVSGLIPESERQISLFDEDFYLKHQPIMKIIDKLNHKYHEDKLKLGSQDIKRTWKMKQARLSKRFSTNIKEIIQIMV